MTDNNKSQTLLQCPCGTERIYQECCGQYLEQGKFPGHAEALMRSRYTAYTIQRDDYLLATWHPDTRPEDLNLSVAPQNRWLGLKIRRYEQSGPEQAIVEFVARYKIGGRAYRLHEISRFVFIAGRWFYFDGDIIHDSR